MRNTIFIILSVVLLSGCSLYKVDVQQGNIIDVKTMSQLYLGMSKGEVNSLLGTPVLVDPFDSDIWLYAYTKQIRGGKIEKKKLVLTFKNNKLDLMQ